MSANSNGKSASVSQNKGAVVELCTPNSNSSCDSGGGNGCCRASVDKCKVKGKLTKDGVDGKADGNCTLAGFDSILRNDDGDAPTSSEIGDDCGLFDWAGKALRVNVKSNGQVNVRIKAKTKGGVNDSS